MKKIISLVLVLVLVFSLAVPSFAYPQSDTEMEALNEIEYWTYWIHQDFTGYFLNTHEWLSSIWQVLTNSIAANVDLMETDVDSLAQNMLTLVSRSESSLSNLLDINEYLRSVNSEITSLNDNLFGNMAFLQPFAQTIGTNSNTIVSKLTTLESNIAQLKEVLADDEDLAFKESQKENQQYIQDTFFKPGSDLSLNVSELTDFTSQFTDFTDSFDFIEKVGTSTSPLESISEGSDFSQWFTNETGQDMDPTFGGGSGGGGGETPDPDEPNPDEPDPPTPTIKNWLPLSTTEPGGSVIYNGVGYLDDSRLSTSDPFSIRSASGYFSSGFIPATTNDVVYFYRPGSSSSIVAFFVGLYSSSGFYYLSSEQLSVDENGVVSILIDKQNVSSIRFTGVGIGSDVIVSINQYPIQTVSTFSLRASSVPYEPEIVTSAYSNRMNEFYKLLGGDD